MFRELALGVRYLFRGWHLMWQPRMRPYVVVPALINLILIGAGSIYGIRQVNRLTSALANTRTWWADILNAVSWLIYPLLMVTILLFLLYLFTLVANWVGAPFNGLLSERVEASMTGTRKNGSLLDLMRDIPRIFARELRKLAYFLPRALGILILFLFGITAPFAALLWFGFSAWILTLQFIDYPMDNHHITFSAMRQKMSQRRWLCLGFGLGCTLLLLIPLANLLLMPMAVCGATALYIEQFTPEAHHGVTQ